MSDCHNFKFDYELWDDTWCVWYKDKVLFRVSAEHVASFAEARGIPYPDGGTSEVLKAMIGERLVEYLDVSGTFMEGYFIRSVMFG